MRPRKTVGPTCSHGWSLVPCATTARFSWVTTAEHVLDLLAGRAAQLDRVLAELHAGRLDQAQGLEELLHRGHAAGGRSGHGVGPAVGLVPAGHGAALDQGGRLLRRVVSLRRQLARAQRAGQHALGKRPDGHLHAHRTP